MVAVHGIGGLGHLGVQYARRMGFKTVAIDRGNDKEPLARKLGAHHYIDSRPLTMSAAELQKARRRARDSRDRAECASDFCAR